MDLRCKQPSKYGRQWHCTACTAHLHGVSLSVDFSHCNSLSGLLFTMSIFAIPNLLLKPGWLLHFSRGLPFWEVFTLPHLFRTASARTARNPCGIRVLVLEFFLALLPVKFRVRVLASPSSILAQSAVRARTR